MTNISKAQLQERVKALNEVYYQLLAVPAGRDARLRISRMKLFRQIQELEQLTL